MLFALIAALFGSGGDISNKNLLGKQKLPRKEYLPFIFLALTAISVFFIPVGFRIEKEAFDFINILIFVLMIASAIGWNIFTSKSLQKEPLHEYESVILLTPIFTILLASIILPSERNLHAFIAGLISSGVLLITRFKKHHFEITKNVKNTLMAVFLMAVEAVLLKMLLEHYSPAFLYFVRVLIMAIFFSIYCKPDWQILKIKPIYTNIILSAICGTGVMVLKYYAFFQIGVVKTTIVLLISPILTFIASYYYFSEHRNFKRDAICASVVILCILYSTLVK